MLATACTISMVRRRAVYESEHALSSFYHGFWRWVRRWIAIFCKCDHHFAFGAAAFPPRHARHSRDGRRLNGPRSCSRSGWGNAGASVRQGRQEFFNNQHQLKHAQRSLVTAVLLHRKPDELGVACDPPLALLVAMGCFWWVFSHPYCSSSCFAVP